MAPRTQPYIVSKSKGWLASDWRPSEANRRAEYYRLTTPGKRQLAREHSKWRERSGRFRALYAPQEGQ